MTADKYQHHCPLEERVKSIEVDVCDIKGMVAGMYDRFGDLVNTAEATYKTVSYHQPDGTISASPDDDWDFLDGED